MKIDVHKPPKPRRKFPRLEAQVAENLHRTGWFVQSLIMEFFKQYGLTHQQYNVLRVLYNADEEEGLPSLEIGRRMVQKLPDITRLIDRIEKSGWVTRERSNQDRRVVRVCLTDEGRTLCGKLEGPIMDFSAEYLSHMSQDELQQLNDLLEKVRGD